MTAASLRASGRRGRRPNRRIQARTWWQRLVGEDGILPRACVAILVVLLVLLQFRLWAGDGGVQELWRLSHMIDDQTQENAVLRERNEALNAEVVDLKQGAAAVEERARSELSMIRRDETFFQSVDR